MVAHCPVGGLGTKDETPEARAPRVSVWFTSVGDYYMPAAAAGGGGVPSMPPPYSNALYASIVYLIWYS